MSDQSESGDTLISKLDFGDPLYMHPSDISSTPLVSIKLLGTENYRVWQCAMTLALETKNKIGFIDNTCEKSETDDTLAKQWDRCNSVVLSWILGSLSEEVYLGQVFSKIASDVWLELKETYDKVDSSAIFNLYKKINSLTQNGSSLSKYYHKINAYWRQYDAMVKLLNCTCNAAKEHGDHKNLTKLWQFLMGLDDTYQHIRSTLLTTDPLPTVKSAYATLSREESHRASVYSSTKLRPLLLCHTIDRCFEIIGYPPSFNRRVSKNPTINNSWSNNTGVKSFSSNNAAVDTSVQNTTLPFSEEQISKLMSLLNNDSIFGNLKSNMEEHPNGTKAYIKQIGDYAISSHITLFDVLVVPEYMVNLMSVHRVARDSKKFLGFDEHYCYIQDLPNQGIMGKTLGIGSVHGGLYVLDDKTNCGNAATCLSSSVCYLSKSTWHNRLGHPADPLLQEQMGSNCGDDSGLKVSEDGGFIQAASRRRTRNNSLDDGKVMDEGLSYDGRGRDEGWTPSSVLLGKFPYEKVYGVAPRLGHLRVFGCLCFATRLNNHDKFSARSEKCAFIGYSDCQKGYKLYSLDLKTVFISRDVKFYENVFPFKMSLQKESDDLNNVTHLNFFETDITSDGGLSYIPNDENFSSVPSDKSDGIVSPTLGSISKTTTHYDTAPSDTTPGSSTKVASVETNYVTHKDTLIHEDTSDNINDTEGDPKIIEPSYDLRISSRQSSIPKKNLMIMF
ncbi:uncharacterized protein [Rutidosis leptorrhynchoides]|uniref:uncharacterized protein n=1 Tax=Rutidosis leptorrhynchoides TaxID=125765 RepID=UPI003A99D120